MKRIPFLLVAAFFTTSAYAGSQQPGSHFIEMWDQNSDGHVTLAEATERRTNIFASFDDNDDGFLSASDYKTFDDARAADQVNHTQGKGKGKGKGANAQVGMQMDFNDVNNDSKVSLEEFTAQTAAWFAMMDKNGDGIISTDDFGRGN